VSQLQSAWESKDAVFNAIEIQLPEFASSQLLPGCIARVNVLSDSSTLCVPSVMMTSARWRTPGHVDDQGAMHLAVQGLKVAFLADRDEASASGFTSDNHTAGSSSATWTFQQWLRLRSSRWVVMSPEVVVLFARQDWHEVVCLQRYLAVTLNFSSPGSILPDLASQMYAIDFANKVRNHSPDPKERHGPRRVETL